jgi:hypothetical protein
MASRLPHLPHHTLALRARGVDTSESKQASTFAPKVIAKHELGRGFTTRDMAAAMQRLFNSGRIKAGVLVCKGANRHPKYGLGRSEWATQEQEPERDMIVGHAKGEAKQPPLRPTFDRRIKFEFHGAGITSDGGLLAYRELDDVLGLAEIATTRLLDGRRGKNSCGSSRSIIPTPGTRCS